MSIALYPFKPYIIDKNGIARPITHCFIVKGTQDDFQFVVRGNRYTVQVSQDGWGHWERPIDAYEDKIVTYDEQYNEWDFNMHSSIESKYYYMDLEGVHFTIDWGDGTETRIDASSEDAEDTFGLRSHEYPSSADWTITVKDYAAGFIEFNDRSRLGNENSQKLIKIVTPFPENPRRAFYGWCFSQAENLESVPSRMLSRSPAGDSIPEGLWGLFDRCPSLIDVPGDVFAGLEKFDIRGLKNLFIECSFKIPLDLFKYFPKLEGFDGLFKYGTENQHEIPADLFKYNEELRYAGDMISYHEGITTVPAGLFNNNKKLKAANGTLSESLLTTIPEDFFTTNNIGLASLANFFSNTNRTPKRLRHVPDGFWTNVPNVTDFRWTFDYCQALDQLPELWTMYPTPERRNYCFRGCSNVTNYGSVPDNWK